MRRSVEERLDCLERVVTKQRCDQATMLVMMRGGVADFDERMNDVVERVAALEAART